MLLRRGNPEKKRALDSKMNFFLVKSVFDSLLLFVALTYFFSLMLAAFLIESAECMGLVHYFEQYLSEEGRPEKTSDNDVKT